MLRDYQTDIIESTRRSMMAGHKSVLIQLATGGGKTLTIGHVIMDAIKKGKRVWFCVHRKELIEQTSEVFFKTLGLDHGFLAAGIGMAPSMSLQLCSIQSIAKRVHLLPPPDLIIFDECHHCAAKSWDDVFNFFPDAFKIGLTATPQRLDGTGLNRWFSIMVNGPAVAQLIEQGFLSKYKYFAPKGFDESQVGIRMGDFNSSDISDEIEKKKIIGDVLEQYENKCGDKRMIVFCASVRNSVEVAERFNRAGISAAHIDGKTHKAVRAGIIKDFRAGAIKILSNVELLGEGFDVPKVESVALLRPTQSLSLYLQQVGRALRPAEGKEFAIILDHVGNYKRHGFPDDERVWNLESEKRKGRSTPITSVKECPKCFLAMPSIKPVCPECGHKFIVVRVGPEEVEGELEEIDPGKIRRMKKQEVYKAETLEDLKLIATERGYKPGWAEHIFKARQNKRNNNGR